MKFHGLFIGIDRYHSPSINWLNCAKRDALALHSLFTDTLGSNTTLLTDEEATRVAIERELQRLVDSDADDVVVVAFSGHGSETHELVTYDADIHDLASSCIPLNTLFDWFGRIPSRRLLCILDCCFSGGIGAKVLHVDAKPRNIQSTDALLEQLSGEGRLIFTASLATEEAWEDQKHGHGLLTFHLLEALQGTEEVRQAGKVDVYSLLKYVTERVVDAAAQIGKQQHPAMRGTIDGTLTWPIFRPGDRFRAAFPGRSRQPATSDIQSLTHHGFPPEYLECWASSIPSLNQLQLDAINEFRVLEGEHLVVSAPRRQAKR